MVHTANTEMSGTQLEYERIEECVTTVAPFVSGPSTSDDPNHNPPPEQSTSIQVQLVKAAGRPRVESFGATLSPRLSRDAPKQRFQSQREPTRLISEV